LTSGLALMIRCVAVLNRVTFTCSPAATEADKTLRWTWCHPQPSARLCDISPNGLLAGSNAYTVRRLQRVQNTAARLVLDVPHSSRRLPLPPVLRELHWLPIESRIKFKLCILIYRVSHGTAPLYLCELCKPCTDSRLRSKSTGDFSTPQTRLRFTDKAFAVSAPFAWNSLPIDIHDCSSEATFKKHLGTFLFHLAFN